MPLILLSSSPFPPLPHHHHYKIPYSQQPQNTIPAISLLRQYVRNGQMGDAHKLFDEMPQRSQVSWTILMSGYAQHGPATHSLSLLCDMINGSSSTNSQPDPFVLSVCLKACASVGSPDFGRGLHCSAVKLGYMEDLFVSNALVSMYSACGFLYYSESVFRRIRQPDLVSWSSILSGFVKNGHEDEAVGLFLEMARTGIRFDSYVLSVGLKGSCTDFGIQFHCYMIKMGFDSSFLYNSLVEFYGRVGELASLRKVFDKMLNRDLVSWNTVISCHARSLCSEEALTFFSEMMCEGLSKCDMFTLGSTLHAVTKLGALNYGREIHGYVIRAGFGSNSYVISALLDMYIKCTNRDIVPVNLFIHFQSMAGELDEFIVASIIKSCALRQDLETGKMIHSCILKLRMELDPFVISSLIDMYAKCGALDASLRVFAGVQTPGTVPWSAIISAHCLNSEFEEALRLFRKMQLDGVKANEFTYTSAIVASTALGDLGRGIEIHCSVIRSGYSLNSSVVNTLINLYLEVRQFEKALKLTSSISEDEVSWVSLIQTFQTSREHGKTLKVFHRIQQNYGHLDHDSACSVLNSCSTLVLLNAGAQAHAYLFKRGLFADPDTSNSLIDMYSNCGTLEHALNAFNQLPDKTSTSWTSIISALVDHGYPSKALDEFMKMIRKGKSPDSNTFLSVLTACGRMGLINEAFQLFTSMIEVHNINPTVEMYSCMVEVLSCSGMFIEAEHFIESAIPFKPDASFWRAILSSCQNHGNMRTAKLAAEKLLELEASDLTTNALLRQVLLQSGKWNVASKLESRTSTSGPSWIETRGEVTEFGSGQVVVEQVSSKLMEVGRKMEELGYVTDDCHWLHNTGEYKGKKSYYSHHTELMALAYGLICLPQGIPVRVFKFTRMCGDCHSACKLISMVIGRDIVIKDSCKFHHFKDGRCSCKDKW